MNEAIVGVLFRGGERLVVVAAAAVSIWLGYKLFDRVISDKGSFEGTLGQWTVKMQRIAPGVFFALFGACVLIFSLQAPFVSSSIEKPDGQLQTVSYGNQVMPAPSQAQAMNLLSAIASIQVILDKPTTQIDPNDRQLLGMSTAPLIRYRDQLVDVAWGKGALNWYVQLFGEIQKDPNRLATLPKEDIEKFNAIQTVMDPK